MRISIIVPVRDEENSIGVLLDGLLAQSLQPFEIVITDGGSTDTTASIIKEYIERGAPIQLVMSGRALPGRGRNLAAKQAVGEWLAFIDAGVRPDERWLENLSAPAINQAEVAVVYGSYEPITNTLFKECAAIAYVPAPIESGDRYIRPRSIVSALMRRSVWESAGGFPEDLRSAEDLLFMNKVEAGHHRIAYAPDAVVHWNVQPTLWRTLKRFITYARNNMRAGLWRDWQAKIFKRYALLGLLVASAFALGYSWFLIGLGLWLLMLTARGIVSIWRNRHAYPAGPIRNLRRLLILVPINAVLDAATFIGSFQWLIKDRLQLAGRRSELNSDT